MMDEELITPLFAYDQSGPRFTVAEVARLLEEPGVPADTIMSQVRSLAQRRFVQVRGHRGSGRTAHNLYELDDCAAAKVLSLLTTDFSISDNDVLQQVSHRLYAWTDKAKASRPRHPISAALLGVSRGESWVFRMDVLRSDQSGKRDVRAYLFDMDKGLPRDLTEPEYMPRGSVTIPLMMLRTIFARVASDRTKAN